MSSFKSTGISYLIRRECGNYYWQARMGGASRRGSLRTKKLSTAKARLPIALSKARKKWEGGGEQNLGDLVTVGDWLKEWRRRQMARPSLKQATKDHDGKLVRLLLEQGWVGKTGPVFTIKTPARAMGRACARLGMRHLTPYDLRHFFVTMCIEAGIDVPTVALWAGHQDGGALIMSTYTHVRRTHSIREAGRVAI